MGPTGNRQLVLAIFNLWPVPDFLISKERMMKIGAFLGNSPDKPMFLCHLSGHSQCSTPVRIHLPSVSTGYRDTCWFKRFVKCRQDISHGTFQKSPEENSDPQRHASAQNLYGSSILKRDTHCCYHKRLLHFRAAKNMSGNYPGCQARTWNQVQDQKACPVSLSKPVNKAVMGAGWILAGEGPSLGSEVL